YLSSLTPVDGNPGEITDLTIIEQITPKTPQQIVENRIISGNMNRSSN
ncbi:MAG: hypothetical protein GW795_04570, partial [Cyanobacteria bacterium]|nr:hypothetical protein [Cyanobacteria bacterium CG_2015-04_32_10]